MQARILQQVAADDLGGDDLVADVLGDDDERSRNDDQDRIEAELRMQDVGHREPCCVMHRREVDDAERERYEIPDNDGDQDRDGCRKSSVEDLAEDRQQQCDDENDDQFGVDVIIPGRLVEDDAAVAGRAACELQTDQCDDRAHGCGRQDDVDPVDADELDQHRDRHEYAAGDDKPA